jgi:spore germination protein KC
MNRQEARGFLLIRDQPFTGPIVVLAGEDRRVRVALETSHFRTRRRVLLRNGRPAVELEVRWDGNVAEVMRSFDLTKPGALGELEKLAAAAITNDMRACLRRVQKELKSDVVGFGASTRRAHPRDWQRLRKNWDRIYPEVPVTVRVQAKLRRVGVVTRPLTVQ